MPRARLVLLLIFLAALTAGCSAPGGLRVSGFGFFNNRNVTEGEFLEVEIPVGPRGPTWRLASFDSAMLAFRGSNFVRTESGMIQRLRFLARTQGQTTLEFDEVPDGSGPASGRATMNVRIFPRN